jgi:hypothetical protein
MDDQYRHSAEYLDVMSRDAWRGSVRRQPPHSGKPT